MQLILFDELGSDGIKIKSTILDCQLVILKQQVTLLVNVIKFLLHRVKAIPASSPKVSQLGGDTDASEGWQRCHPFAFCAISSV